MHEDNKTIKTQLKEIKTYLTDKINNFDLRVTELTTHVNDKIDKHAETIKNLETVMKDVKESMSFQSTMLEKQNVDLKSHIDECEKQIYLYPVKKATDCLMKRCIC